MIKRYIAEIRTEGPLFIGSGQEIKKTEYIFDESERFVYVMDTLKMFKGLQKLNLLDKFENFIFTQANAAAPWGKGQHTGNKPREKNLFDFVRDNNVNPAEYKSWAAYRYEIPEYSNMKVRNNIMANVKDAYGMPYLPGSSLKGALANILLSDKLLKKDNSEIEREIETAEFRKRDSYLNNVSGKVLMDEFFVQRDEKVKPNNAVNSTFRGLVIGDSRPLSCKDLVLCQKIDIPASAVDGDDKPMPLYRECIKPGTVISVPVEIDTDVFPYDGAKIEAAVKAVYSNLAEKYLQKFPQIDTEPTQKDAEANNYLYLGGGTGYAQKTLVYSIYKDREKAVKAAAKILDKVSPKGKNAKASDHSQDHTKYKVSPRLRKSTYCDGKDYDFGLCSITFKPI